MPKYLKKEPNSTESQPIQVLEIINYFLHTAYSGFLIVSVQDGYVVKMEKTERFTITAKSRQGSYVKIEKPKEKHPLCVRILTELQDIRYGQLIIRLDNGQVDHLEKTEKRRIHEFEGVDGAGI
ncbi:MULTISPECIES: DUF2292 domain-containing protein [Pelosinus]|uniref:DUF2292 domain-containing protein n=1 Tax=Pelosinus fermentans B4 TaxID=1149862 RepID=I8RH04_9FIRM|nr:MULTISPECIES: DUF2292 domain-containing protein [Pelosinus]EIW17120.1 hypothetical protein FB4_4476 [Pelosinus fermentans B4]EIW23081.1 hypothetical protein FA11_4522 [Pelosinus fermentans A11]OAM93877.1 hypothetical protein FR7_01894 [Pelosinus fermentans DSM 17108]SDQ93177.1 Uncharacterized small protein [Pelosinus fermentans]